MNPRRWWPERLFRAVLLADLPPGTLFWNLVKPEPYPQYGSVAGPYVVRKHVQTCNGVLTSCTYAGQEWPTSGGTVYVPRYRR